MELEPIPHTRDTEPGRLQLANAILAHAGTLDTNPLAAVMLALCENEDAAAAQMLGEFIQQLGTVQGAARLFLFEPAVPLREVGSG